MSQDIIAIVLLGIGLLVGFGYCRAFDRRQ
jgi:hypothetical protein